MAGLVVREWRRYGQDRLYINDQDTGTRVASYDRNTGKITVEDQGRAFEAVEALRPFLTTAQPPPNPGPASARASAATGAGAGTRTEAWADPAKGGDLAQNTAGSAAAARAEELSPRGLRRLVTTVLRLPTEATPWQVGARGERIVGGRLDRLKREGWGTLHAIRLRSGADIDHLIVGPPGVFTINTKHHRNARIKVGDHVVWVNGFKQPYLRNSRHEAEHVARVLRRACGRNVPVTPVLAFVGAAELSMTSYQLDVLAIPGERIDRVLRKLPRVLTPQEHREVYEVARRSEIWLT
jgi:Nuclease-related domain